MSGEFCLKWDNHTSIMKEFKEFLAIDAMVDVTLACDGVSIKAHKIILSACSPFFKGLFLGNPCKHPIVILKDVKYTDLQAILQFIYHGRVSVAQDQLLSLIKTAETLGVKGLGDVESQDNLFDSGTENPFENEYENQSNGDSNLESSQQQSVHDQSDNDVFVTDIKQELSDETSSNAIIVPSQDDSVNTFLSNDNEVFKLEIKQELWDEISSNAIIAPSQANSVNTFIPNQESQAAENFQDFAPNFHGQSSTTNSLTKDSSTQTTIMLHQNYYDDMASLTPVVSNLKHSSVSVSLSQQSNSSGAIAEELAKMEPTTSSTLTLAECEAIDMEEENKDDDEHCSSIISPEEDSQVVKVKKRKKRKRKKQIAASHSKKLKKKTKMITSSSIQPQLNSQKQTVVNSSDSGSKKEADETKISEITKRERKFHRCSICTFKTINMMKFKMHLSNEHSGPFQCNLCEHTSMNKSGLRHHTATVHRERHFACDWCPTKCTSDYDLMRHHSNFHVDKKPLKCKKCKFSTFLWCSFEKHMIIMHKKKV